MGPDRLDDIAEGNPEIDRTAVDRSRRARARLAEAGITLGGYRLAPALGGADPEQPGDVAAKRSSNAQRVYPDETP